jgi:hypothetical protein
MADCLPDSHGRAQMDAVYAARGQRLAVDDGAGVL